MVFIIYANILHLLLDASVEYSWMQDQSIQPWRPQTITMLYSSKPYTNLVQVYSKIEEGLIVDHL